jgi:hypothetical protein
MKKIAVTSIVLTAALAGFVACKGDDDDHHDHSHLSPYPACDAIIEACHPVDKGEGRISECHTTAHEAQSDATCAPIKDECIRVCEGAASDAGGQ